MDPEANAAFIIGRVFDFGDVADIKTAKDFYGILKNVKVSSEDLEKELDKAKKLWRF